MFVEAQAQRDRQLLFLWLGLVVRNIRIILVKKVAKGGCRESDSCHGCVCESDMQLQACTWASPGRIGSGQTECSKLVNSCKLGEWWYKKYTRREQTWAGRPFCMSQVANLKWKAAGQGRCLCHVREHSSGCKNSVGVGSRPNVRSLRYFEKASLEVAAKKKSKPYFGSQYSSTIFRPSWDQPWPCLASAVKYAWAYSGISSHTCVCLLPGTQELLSIYLKKMHGAWHSYCVNSVRVRA